MKKWIFCDCNENSNEVGIGVVIQNSKSEVITYLFEKILLPSSVFTLEILTA